MTQIPKPTERQCTRWWIPAVLLLAFAAQSLWFIRTQSITFDEPTQILAGMHALQTGAFLYYNDAPLARHWFAIPIAQRENFVRTVKMPYCPLVVASKPDLQTLANRTRPMVMLLGLALGAALWFATRSLFSEAAANVALALFAFMPSLIAHFSLATLDGMAALTVFVATWQVVRWRRNPTWKQTVLLGAALGAMLISKLYTLPIFLFLVACVLCVGPQGVIRSVRKWNLRKFEAVLGVAFVVVWAGYFFHVSTMRVDAHAMTIEYSNRPATLLHNVPLPDMTFMAPAGEYFDTVGVVLETRTRSSYLLGEVKKGGWHSYFALAILLKWPTVVLLLFVFGIVWVGWARRLTLEQAMMAGPPLILFALASWSRMNIGERHILPVIPFVLLFAGATWECVRGHRVGQVALVALLALNAADAQRYAPNYLSYFNVFVRQTDSWHLLSDSNVDWGQGLISLREYEAQHTDEPIYFAGFQSVDPKLYGIRAKELGEQERVEGLVVVSPVQLSGLVLKDPEAYRWVLQYPRVAVLDHVLQVYDTRKSGNRH